MTGIDPPIAEKGVGAPVLVLHGGTGPASVAPLVAHLAERHHVLAPTHPGWSGVPRSAGISSAADLARAYLGILASRELADVTVVGSSFGGWIAVEMAVQDAEREHGPRRIARLVTIDGLGPAVPGVEVPPFQSPAPVGGQPGGHAIPEEARLALAALSGYLGRGMTDPTLTPRAAALDLPVLVVWGTDDDVVPAEYGRGLAGLIPGATFAAIDHAGHMPHLGQPGPTFRAIDEALGA